MRKSHLDFLKVIVLLTIISLFNNLIFSFTVEDIINKSKTDPEFAWDMYLLYLSNQEASHTENIDKLGQFLYAKRKLRDFEFAVKEDIEGLINFLKSSNLNNSAKYYLLSIFNEEDLFKYMCENLKKDSDVLYLLKLISNYDYKTLSKELLNLLIEGENIQNYVHVLSKIQNSEVLVRSLVDDLRTRLADTENDEGKKKYLEIYKRVLAYYPELKDQTLEKFDKRLSSRPFSFNELLRNLWNLLKEAFQSLAGSKQNITILTMIFSLIIFGTFFLFPGVRYFIYSLFGSWRMAALVYKKIVEKDPLNEEKRLKLAQLYEKAGMYEEAMNEYNFLKRIKLE